LERAAVELGQGLDDALAWKGALAWSWHSIGLLAYVRLQPASDSFDPWIRDYFLPGEPDLDVERDAQWEERQRLSFLELIDLLSAQELSILKPSFYQGWQERSSRCRELRREVTELVGASLEEEQRQQLLYLLAAYHRLIRLPTAARIDVTRVHACYPALLDLARMLLMKEPPGGAGAALLTAISNCRHALD
jgi:hypothetical protein